MSIDCVAPPESVLRADRMVGMPTSHGVQLKRWTRLLACLAQLYVYARQVLGGRAAAGADDRRRWARRLLAALDVDVRLRGHVPAPDAPLLLVANHISWLDSYALNSATHASFVAKAEIAHWPVIGPIARAFDTLFLRRGSCRAAARMAAAVAAALARGTPIGVFPEGTTSWGDGLLPFYAAMFQAAVWSGARVQPVAIRYSDARGRRTDAPAYVDDVSVLESLRRITREPCLSVELVFCAPIDPAGRTRRQLAALARQAIAAALALDDGDVTVAPTPLRRAA
jgi:1-acyl-sn-glycerol-3-phosphate acyltransferase